MHLYAIIKLVYIEVLERNYLGLKLSNCTYLYVFIRVEMRSLTLLLCVIWYNTFQEILVCSEYFCPCLDIFLCHNYMAQKKIVYSPHMLAARIWTNKLCPNWRFYSGKWHNPISLQSKSLGLIPLEQKKTLMRFLNYRHESNWQ